MFDSLYLSSRLPSEIEEVQLTSFSSLFSESILLSPYPSLSKKEHLITLEKPDRLKRLFSKTSSLSNAIQEHSHPSHTLAVVDEETLEIVLSERIDRQILFWASAPITSSSLLKKLIKSDVRIAVTSKHLQASFEGLQTVVLSPAYLPMTFPEQERHASFIVGMVAPLEPQKGHETILRALHATRELLPQLRVILVGDGSEKRRIQWLIDHLHLRQSVQMVSRQEHYERFITNFDVFVAAQENPRGWSPSIMHALSQGVPVIASKIGVHEDLLKHGKDALLFEPGNSTVLAQHIINLYNNPDWMQHYQIAGPQLLQEQYTLEHLKKGLLALF